MRWSRLGSVIQTLPIRDACGQRHARISLRGPVISQACYAVYHSYREMEGFMKGGGMKMEWEWVDAV